MIKLDQFFFISITYNTSISITARVTFFTNELDEQGRCALGSRRKVRDKRLVYLCICVFLYLCR